MVMDTMVFAYALLGIKGQYNQAIIVLETAEQIIVPIFLNLYVKFSAVKCSFSK